jgi:cellulose biosynthesis protein BcsQ
MTTVAVLSLKGGVGKTTCVLGLAGAAWARDMSVLVIDADPQANATAALDLPPHLFSLGDVLADGRPGIAKDAVVPSGWGPRLHAVPSEEALAHRNRPEGPDSATRLRVSLTGVADHYDLVLIDCPPSLDELTRNALAAADGALVVTEPGFFALQGATRALAAIDAARDTLNLRLRPVGICVNRLRTQLTEHRYRLEELHMAFPDLIIDPPIPERSAVQQAQGASVPIQAWPSPGAREAVEAFDDVLDRVLH